MTTAEQLIGGPNSRYKMKQVVASSWHGVLPDWILARLEEFHEEGWEVCGVSPAGMNAIWIIYRRTGQ